MIIRVLQAVRASLTPRRYGGPAGRADPRLKFAGLVLLWAGAMFSWEPVELGVLVVALAVLAVLSRGSGVTGYALAVSSVGGLTVFFVTLIFSPLPIWGGGLYRSLALAVRAYVVSAYTLLFVVTTNPLALADSLGVRGRVYDYIVVSSRSLPLVLGMTEEAYVALRSTGRSLHRVALPVFLESMRRAGYLAESLFLRGYGMGNRGSRRVYRGGSLGWGLVLFLPALTAFVVGVLF